MTTTFWFGAAMTASGTIATLAGERAGRPILEWIFKPFAALGFLIAAHGAGCFSSPYGSVLFVGLVLCAAGDVLLIPRDSRSAFLGGLGSFLLGHVGFTVAFLVRGVDVSVVGMTALPLLLVGGAVLRWLAPHVPGAMVGPVRAYVVVIMLMVATAAGATAFGGPTTIVTGALAFMASDLAVARERFVAPGPGNRLWGLPLYFGAQLVLASTAAF